MGRGGTLSGYPGIPSKQGHLISRRRGYTIPWSGWQVTSHRLTMNPPAPRETIRVPIARNRDGSPITGPVLARWEDLTAGSHTLAPTHGLLASIEAVMGRRIGSGDLRHSGRKAARCAERSRRSRRSSGACCRVESRRLTWTATRSPASSRCSSRIRSAPTPDGMFRRVASRTCGGRLTCGFVLFARTRAERVANGDPRPSLEERYGDEASYLRRVASQSSSYAVERE
jgi:hypothetical protein